MASAGGKVSTFYSYSPRRLPELEDLPHDSVVAELAQEDNRPIGGRALFEYRYRSSESKLLEYGFPSWTRAAARDERPEAENLLVRQATVGLPATAARADAGSHGLYFDERLVMEKLGIPPFALPQKEVG